MSERTELNAELNHEQKSVIAYIDGMLLSMEQRGEYRSREERIRLHRAFPFLDEITDDMDELQADAEAARRGVRQQGIGLGEEVRRA